MFRWLLAWSLAFLLLLPVLASNAPANRTAQAAPFAASGGSGQLDTYIEEQNNYSDCCTIVPPAISNPYPGTYWDINDWMGENYSGYLDPGSVSVVPINIVWDPNPLYSCRPICNWWSFRKHFYSLSVTASSPSLSVTICFTPQNRCFTPHPVWNGLARSKALWTWRFHGQVVYHGNPLDPVVATIPDSHGGVGVLSQVTGTITNAGTGRVKSVTASEGVSSDVFGVCSGYDPCTDLVSDYPFTWSLS